MDEFFEKVKAYARLCGVTPGTVIQNASAGSGGAWARWTRDGAKGPTLSTVDKVYKYIADNPAPEAEGKAA